MSQNKYEYWLTADGLNILRACARNGITEQQLADKIGVSRRTISRWKRNHPPIRDALNKGKEIFDNEVEESLFKLAMGHYVEETRETEDEYHETTKTTTKRYIPPNVTAIIFWLKNRRKETWTDVNRKTAEKGNPEIEQTSGIVILPEIKERN